MIQTAVKHDQAAAHRGDQCCWLATCVPWTIPYSSIVPVKLYCYLLLGAV